MKQAFDPNCITISQINMIFNSRLFQRYQTVWTRVYITSRYENIGTAEQAFGRLYLENSDFGDQLQFLFGRIDANIYAQKMNDFSIGIREMITAQLRGDTEAMQRAVNRLYRNTKERAAFLASLNPYFDENQLQNMFADYLHLTIEEANSFASQDFSRNIEIYNQLMILDDRIGFVFAEGVYDYITSGGECIKDLKPGECLPYEQVNAIFYGRMLWFEIITWTNAHILSVVENIGNEEEVRMRSRIIADAYYDTTRTTFGEEAGMVSEQHINLFIDLLDGLIKAQMVGDIDTVNENTRLLYQDAHAHAQHLASLNSYWEESIWDVILYDIVQNLIRMLTALLAGNYATYTDIFSELLEIADKAGKYFVEGIYQYMISNNINLVY